MTTTHYDIAVIGGGPGGYVAAIRAAQLGLNVVVVEREHVGGICLNWGCIPTKALLRAAELRHSIDEMTSFGISVGEVTIDVSALVKRSRNVAARLSSGVTHLLKKNKIPVIKATATIGKKLKNGRNVLLSDGATISASHVLIATGASQLVPLICCHCFLAAECMPCAFSPHTSVRAFSILLIQSSGKNFVDPSSLASAYILTRPM